MEEGLYWGLPFWLHRKKIIWGEPVERGSSLGRVQAPKLGTQGWPLLWVELCSPTPPKKIWSPNSQGLGIWPLFGDRVFAEEKRGH